MQFLVGEDENVLKLMIVAQSCKCAKKHRIAHFKWMNYVADELDFIKAV